MTHPSDDLDPREAAALAGLRADAAPDPALEDRVSAGLRRQGAFATRRRLRPEATRLAAAAILLAAGFGLGRLSRGTAAPPEATWLLLLEKGAAAAEHEPARVAEYAAWARALASRGSLVAAEKLEPRSRTLSRRPDGSTALADAASSPLGGFFLVRARDEAEALAVASACPHLAHGGEVVLRRIEPTSR